MLHSVLSDDLGDLHRAVSRFSSRWQNVLDTDDQQALRQVAPLLTRIASKLEDGQSTAFLSDEAATNTENEAYCEDHDHAAATAPTIEAEYEETSMAPAGQMGSSAKIIPDDSSKDLTKLAPSQRGRPPYFFNPEDPKKVTWDITMQLFLLYNIVVIPLRMCWDINVGLDEPVFIWDSIVDWCFVIDIAFNFRTGVIMEGKVIYEQNAIARDYFKLWFWIDFVSSIPIDFFMTITGAASVKHVKMLRMFRLVKIAKILRILKMQKVFTALLDQYPIPSYPVNLLFLVVVVLYTTHLLTCFNWALARAAQDEAGNWNLDIQTWAKQYPYWNDQYTDFTVSTQNFDEQYTVSFYWAITTISTVGYGDVLPTNHSERTWTIIVMLVGSAIFAYIVGNISDVVMSKNAASQLSSEKLTAISEYMTKHNVPNVLRIRIRRFLRQLWEEKTVFDEDGILTDLSTKLKTQLLVHVHEHTLRTLHLFNRTFTKDSDRGWDMARELIRHMKPQTIPRGDVILREGDLGQEMWFIMKGEVKVLASVKGVLQEKAGVSGLKGVLSQWKGLGMAKMSRRTSSNHNKYNHRDGHAETGDEILENSTDYISLNTLEKGDHFGEIACLSKAELEGAPDFYYCHRRAATCVSLCLCAMETIDKEPLCEAIRNHEHLRTNLADLAKERILKIETERRSRNTQDVPPQPHSPKLSALDDMDLQA